LLISQPYWRSKSDIILYTLAYRIAI
jgi:hypothetical protein